MECHHTGSYVLAGCETHTRDNAKYKQFILYECKFLGEKTKVGDSSSPFFTHKTDKNHFVNTTGSYVCIFVFAPLFLSL